MKLIESVRETAKVIKTLSRKPRRQPPKRMQARVRATTTASIDEYEEEEPQTKLTSAFVVVLILHLVAVGGIYAFKEIKASRKDAEVTQSGRSTKPVATANQGVQADPSASADVDNTTSSPISAVAASTNPQAGAKPRTYVVKSNDTLHGIAKANGVTVADLKTLNNLTSDSIRQGQVLNLTAAKSVAPAHTDVAAEKTDTTDPKVPSKTYTVKSGDRLVFIAKKFNVTQEELLAMNKIKDPTKLQIGQILKIPAKK
jgi:LysM repeat protein